MKDTKIKTAFALGLVITLVLAVTFYILFRLGGLLKPVITPVAHKLGMQNDLGEIAITLLAILSIGILVFILGWVALLPSVSKYKDKFEGLLLKIYPPLNYLKAMEEERLKVDTARGDWKPVLALMYDQYWPAFIIEENEEWVTLSVLYVPNSDPMEVVIARKVDTPMIPMTTKQMLHFNRSIWKGPSFADDFCFKKIKGSVYRNAEIRRAKLMISCFIFPFSDHAAEVSSVHSLRSFR